MIIEYHACEYCIMHVCRRYVYIANSERWCAGALRLCGEVSRTSQRVACVAKIEAATQPSALRLDEAEPPRSPRDTREAPRAGRPTAQSTRAPAGAPARRARRRARRGPRGAVWAVHCPRAGRMVAAHCSLRRCSTCARRWRRSVCGRGSPSLSLRCPHLVWSRELADFGAKLGPIQAYSQRSRRFPPPAKTDRAENPQRLRMCALFSDGVVGVLLSTAST